MLPLYPTQKMFTWPWVTMESDQGNDCFVSGLVLSVELIN